MHKHSWKLVEGAMARYSCACGAAGRRDLWGRINEAAKCAGVDPDDLVTARPRPAEVMDCTGRVRPLNPDDWTERELDGLSYGQEL